MSVYVAAVRLKKLLPIEALTEEEKRYYWELSKKEAKGTLIPENLKILSKCLYCIEMFLTLKNES